MASYLSTNCKSSRGRKPLSKRKKRPCPRIKPRQFFVDLSAVLGTGLTQKELLQLEELMEQILVRVLATKESRRWRVRLVSECPRLRA